MCYRQTRLRLYKANISKRDIICARDRPERLYKAYIKQKEKLG